MLPDIWISILLAALIAALLLIVEHYAPWFRAIARGKLHPVINYIQGCLALFLPYTVLLVYWNWQNVNYPPLAALIALWIISCAGGLAVVFCYWFDRDAERGRRLREAEARENGLRQSLINGGER